MLLASTLKSILSNYPDAAVIKVFVPGTQFETEDDFYEVETTTDLHGVLIIHINDGRLFPVEP